MTKVLFVGGGSVGHIAPAVAVWEQIQHLIPEARAHFVCSVRPDDSAFLDALSLPYSLSNAPRLSALYPIKILPALREARRILRTEKPDIILSKGGYVSIPLCAEAKKMGIPIVLHESDAVSGYANRIMSRWATSVCVGMTTKDSLPTNYVITGNPLRKEIVNGNKAQGLSTSGLSGDKPILLVMGGSQGAKALNDAVIDNLDDLLLRCDIIHITGRGKMQEEGRQNYFVTEFAHGELADFYACADIALSRAGAGSIGELAANNIPTILVPLRNVGHDHQYHNATAAAHSGGCIHLEQQELTAQLVPTVHTVITDQSLREEMSKKIRTLSHPDAALQIAKIIAQTLDKGVEDE